MKKFKELRGKIGSSSSDKKASLKEYNQLLAQSISTVQSASGTWGHTFDRSLRRGVMINYLKEHAMKHGRGKAQKSLKAGTYPTMREYSEMAQSIEEGYYEDLVDVEEKKERLKALAVVARHTYGKDVILWWDKEGQTGNEGEILEGATTAGKKRGGQHGSEVSGGAVDIRDTQANSTVAEGKLKSKSVDTAGGKVGDTSHDATEPETLPDESEAEEQTSRWEIFGPNEGIEPINRDDTEALRGTEYMMTGGLSGYEGYLESGEIPSLPPHYTTASGSSVASVTRGRSTGGILKYQARVDDEEEIEPGETSKR